MKVAFDIDDTLWKCRWTKSIGRVYVKQSPDYDLIQVVRWFAGNGDDVYFWSSGGMDYCKEVIEKLGLEDLGKVIVKGSIKPDIAFDDQTTMLAKVDVKVRRVVSESK